MTPKEITGKAEALAYIRYCQERLGHLPLAIGLTKQGYAAVARDIGVSPSDTLDIHLGGVLLVGVYA